MPCNLYRVGMQNSGLATSLATTHFAQYPLATIPRSLYSVYGSNISGAVLANIYARSAKADRQNKTFHKAWGFSRGPSMLIKL